MLNFEKKSTWIVLILLSYLAIGSFSLNSGREALAGKTGLVWSQVNRGAELLPRLEALVSKEMSDRTDLIKSLAQSRSNLATAQKAGNLDQAITALSSGLKISVEDNKIPTGVVELEKGLLDETSGTYNRITYARNNLIESQAVYNQSRVFYVPLQAFFPRIEILGENSNPAQNLPVSTFQK